MDSLKAVKNGKPDPYVQCPEYESGNFKLRLICIDDAEDLVLCYGDPEAWRIFNSDNCTGDFHMSTVETMNSCILAWLDAYKNRGFIRYAIIDRNTGKAIGTMEIFGGPNGGKRSDFGVLRIDVSSGYEKEAPLSELINMADAFFYDVNTEMFVTKSIPEASGRINALVKNGYVPMATGANWHREHYYMKKAINT